MTPLQFQRLALHPVLLRPGDPDDSILVVRMESRDGGVMMPSLGSGIVDADAMGVIRAWISGLQGCD